jgi:hypothetical protein
VHISLHHFAAIAVVAAWTVGVMAQEARPLASDRIHAVRGAAAITTAEAAVQTQQERPVNDPVANPEAIVILKHARFTVLTPQLIRMEWAADGKFEDHASFVFINRRLPVPKYAHQVRGGRLTIQTDAVTLTYQPKGDGRFTSDDLSVALTVDGKPVVWRPGANDPENLKGTTRTLDGALGDKTKEPIGNGFVSRTGWAVEDDSTRPLFDSADFRFLHGEDSPWPWVMERPAGERQDLYYFG